MIRNLLHLVQAHCGFFTLLIMTLITVLSLYPLESLPPASGSDKLHHFIAYAVLAFPVALAKPNLWFVVILGLLGFGGLIEIIQPFVNRYGEWLDFVANSLGILMGLTLAFLIRWRLFSKPIDSDR